MNPEPQARADLAVVHDGEAGRRDDQPRSLAPCAGVARIAARLELDFAQVLALEGLPPVPVADMVYLSGSHVEGRATSSSDIDIFVVGDREPIGTFLFPRHRCSVSIHPIQQGRVDFEFWRPQQVEATSERLARLVLGEDYVADRLDGEEQDFIHRLRIALPLSPPEQLAVLQARFDFDRFRRYLTQQAIHHMDAALEDLWGMLDDGETEEALYEARYLLQQTADAWRHARGDTNPSAKWRLRAIRSLSDATGDREFLERYRRLDFPPPEVAGDSALRRRHVEEIIDLARRVTAEIQS